MKTRSFFEKYSQMPRSRQGLSGTGKWDTLKQLLPDFTGKRLLDLGCGYGWHCIYAMEHGAKSALGIDISEKMLSVAREKILFRRYNTRIFPLKILTLLRKALILSFPRSPCTMWRPLRE